MGDKRSYAEVLKEANQQLDGMTGDDLAGKKKEESQKKMKSSQSANVPIPDLKEGNTDPMWGAAAAAAEEEFNEAERDASSSSEEVCVVYMIHVYL